MKNKQLYKHDRDRYKQDRVVIQYNHYERVGPLTCTLTLSLIINHIHAVDTCNTKFVHDCITTSFMITIYQL